MKKAVENCNENVIKKANMRFRIEKIICLLKLENQPLTNNKKHVKIKEK